MSNKKYWIKKEEFIGAPGCDINESLQEFFNDYFRSEKKNEVSIELNDVTVTLKRKGW